MQPFIKNLKLDQANPDGTPPGETKPPEQQPPAAVTPPVEAEGDTHDELGYAKVPPPAPKAAPEGTAPKAGDKPAEAPPTNPEEITDPGTGYGKEAPVVPVAPAAPAPVVTPVAVTDLDKAVEGLPESEAKEIKSFATENALSPEVAKKWADRVKAQIADAVVAQANYASEAERQKLATRAQWHKELKEDKDFGGAKFDLSLSRSEKTLSEFFPELKKELTDGKRMLPPSVMRGLNRIAEKLHATDKLVTGEPNVPVVSKDPTDEALEFYQ